MNEVEKARRIDVDKRCQTMFAHLAGFRRLVAKKLDLNIAKVGMQRYRLGSREQYPPKHACRPCEARDEENASLLLFGASFFIEISVNGGPCRSLDERAERRRGECKCGGVYVRVGSEVRADPCLWRNTIDNKAEKYVRRPNIAL